MSHASIIAGPPAIPAIPTTYRGVLMRSRLEAKWAAFYDLVQWRWAYEPIDLNGYIPDFVLEFHRPMLVDIKPSLELTALAERAHALAATIQWKGELITSGALLMDMDDTLPCAGRLVERYDQTLSVGLAIIFRCLSCNGISIRSHDGSWRCRLCDAYEGNGHVGEIDCAEIQQLWADAGNRVQWKAPR